MLRGVRCVLQKYYIGILTPKQTFLTNEYKCVEAWKSQKDSSILTKVNLNDFYSIINQNYNSKGVISAIDVDIFANALKDSIYLDELKDLIHKLRLSAQTGDTLESTHHATIRNYIEFDHLKDLVSILKDPLKFGIFLDSYTANILLDKLLTSNNYELAANVASLIMLQEDFSNNITNTLCQYSCYKYVSESKAIEPIAQEEDNKKKEELKIRIKFLRNPYFDDHFDITNLHLLSGKTLAWISNRNPDNLNNNLQVIGWLFYKKYDKLSLLCNELVKIESFNIYNEVLELLKKEIDSTPEETKGVLQKCVEVLSTIPVCNKKLDESIKTAIENAINKTQNKDILDQKELFQNWTKIRENKLEEQSKRLDRTKRIQLIEDKQKQLAVEEQKLWFFENEEQIDLQIEEKEKLVDSSHKKETGEQKTDDDYIPPEILPNKK